MEGTLADLCAGWAVGRGALHAGELQKRSEWRRKYNARFVVLTCDELAWFPAPRTNELTCSSWRFTAEGERRAITLHHQLSVGMKGDSLVIAGPGSAVIVKAASEAELHSGTPHSQRWSTVCGKIRASRGCTCASARVCFRLWPLRSTHTPAPATTGSVQCARHSSAPPGQRRARTASEHLSARTKSLCYSASRASQRQQRGGPTSRLAYACS